MELQVTPSRVPIVEDVCGVIMMSLLVVTAVVLTCTVVAAAATTAAPAADDPQTAGEAPLEQLVCVVKVSPFIPPVGAEMLLMAFRI